jgi:hypothetical protein
MVPLMQLLLTSGAAAASPWCPLWHNMYQPKMSVLAVQALARDPLGTG